MAILQKKTQDVGKNKEILKSPLSVGIEITKKCNLGCLYCYNEKDSVVDMKITDFSRITSLLKKLGVFSVSISGGEPLCHGNFSEICNILKKSKIVSTLITNGTLIHKYSDLINTTFANTYISIDGPENIHGKTRGKNYFGIIIKNLKKIKTRKVMCSTLTKFNLGYLEEIAKVAKKYKFDALCLFVFKPVGRGQQNKDLLNLDYNSLEKINSKIKSLKKKFKIKITYTNPLLTLCHAGKQLIYILPDGKIKPCAYSNFIIGNILYDKWDTLWEKSQLYPTKCHAY